MLDLHQAKQPGSIWFLTGKHSGFQKTSHRDSSPNEVNRSQKHDLGPIVFGEMSMVEAGEPF